MLNFKVPLARSASGFALALASMGAAQAVHAQEAEDGASEERIIVTGSRLARDSFSAPTPVQVVGSERMENLAVADVGDALIQLPAFRPITGPATNSFRPSGNISARNLDLRGLGPSRTLVLVDGRRSVPNDESGRLDLNTIPSIMVRSSEVVTGGASAAYGADAVAGVVNLMLDTRFEGLKAEGSWGISEYNDGRQARIGGMLGQAFDGGRGHIVVGGEYVDENEVGDFNARPWAARWRNFPGYPFWSASGNNTLPRTVSLDNVLFLGTPGGVSVLPGPFQGRQFDASGNLIPFNFGDPNFWNPAAPGLFVVNPDPAVDDLYGFNRSALITPNTHKAVLGNIEYDVTDSLTVSTGVSYGWTQGIARGAYAYNFNTGADGALPIFLDNAYLSPAVRQQMINAGVTSFTINRANREGSGTNYTSESKVWRAHLGLEGEFGDGWAWDATYSWGQNKSLQSADNLQYRNRWRAAADAVLAPAGNSLGVPAGTVVCRLALTNAAYRDCIPTNIIGAGVVNPNTLTYAYSQPGELWQSRRYEQNVFSANVRGTPIQNWAGDVNMAAGVEYRIDKAEGALSALPTNAVSRFSYGSVLPAITQKVAEVYLEAGMPLIADSAVGSVDVDGAVRFSDYNLQGSAWTWKAGLVWDVNDSLMFRVTRSHDVRQPTAAELNPNQTVGALPLPDPGDPTGTPPVGPSTYNIDSYSGGNPNLKLEKADTWTVGGVLQPAFIPDFRLSLDFYDITVKGAIDTLSAQLAVQLCRQGNTAVCTINPTTNRITAVYSTFQNVSTLNAQGFELVSNYTLDLDSFGQLDFTLNGAYQTQLDTTLASGEILDYLGVTGNAGSVTNTIGVPKWRADGILTWDMDSYSLTAHGRYIPPGLLNKAWIGPHQDGYSPNLPNSVSDNRISGRFYLDLSGKVALIDTGDRKVELFGSIANVLNRDPPKNLRLFGNGLYFDSFGRYYRAGLRIAM